MAVFNWINFGINNVAEEKSKWNGKMLITDPYGNDISYFFKLSSYNDTNFEIYLHLSFRDKTFMSIEVQYDEVSTNWKVTTIIDEVFASDNYKILFGITSPAAYIDTNKPVVHFQSPLEILPKITQEKETLTIPNLIDIYTKELSDFIEK